MHDGRVKCQLVYWDSLKARNSVKSTQESGRTLENTFQITPPEFLVCKMVVRSDSSGLSGGMFLYLITRQSKHRTGVSVSAWFKQTPASNI